MIGILEIIVAFVLFFIIHFLIGCSVMCFRDKECKDYIKRWNRWRKFNANSKWHKFLVLMGFRYSPTFEFADIIGDEIDNIEGRLDEKISLTVRDENPKEATDE